MRIIAKLNYFTLIFLAITLPFYLYFYYKEVSTKTYQKDYILIKENNYDFYQRVNLSSKPIINENSKKGFIAQSIVSIFNYRTNVAIRNLDEYEPFFNEEGFDNFRYNFRLRVENEIASGVVINEAVLESEPLYMGSYNYPSGLRSDLFYVKVRELKIGETGRRIQGSFEIFVEIQRENFALNGKGLSIRAIEIR